MKTAKDIIRKMFIYFHIDITKNIRYDRLTQKILKTHLKDGYNCIDIGSHKGEILDDILKYSPSGRHYAFEPIPSFYEELKRKYNGRARLFPYALSDKRGRTTFQFVKNAPAYSGLIRRRYDIENPQIEEIEVEVRTLDDIIPKNEIIHFIKIDVEGGEYDVLKGGKTLLRNHKPLTLFEFGIGASDYYRVSSENMYNLLHDEIGLGIYTLTSFLKGRKALELSEFKNIYASNEEFYFVAY